MGRTSGYRGVISLVLLISVFLVLPAGADEVVDSIKAALEQYKQGEYISAAASLDYASQLIREKRSQSLEKFLPEALPGWTSEEATSRTFSTAMLGGGVFVESIYRKGMAAVSIKIITDSPMLQSVMMMFTNPLILTASGSKMETIKGHRAIVDYRPASMDGEIKILVKNSFLIIISGTGVRKEDLANYASQIDYNKLTEQL
ncbi:MAG: hypothetical protein ABH883_05600 [Candidatus Omnitrophota bacterium]